MTETWVPVVPGPFAAVCDEMHERNVSGLHVQGFCRVCAEIYEALNIAPGGDPPSEAEVEAALAAFRTRHDELRQEHFSSRWGLGGEAKADERDAMRTALIAARVAVTLEGPHCDRCDVALRVAGKNWHGVAGRLEVKSIPADEDGTTQWEFVVIDSDTDPDGRPPNSDEMEEIAWLVAQAEAGEDD